MKNLIKKRVAQIKTIAIPLAAALSFKNKSVCIGIIIKKIILNTEEATALCEDLGRELGFARISRISVDKHDEMIAFLSQLTHAIAVTLMCCNDSPDLVDYTGDSFRDLTRIAKIDDVMWNELFMCNRDELARQMDIFSETFEKMRKALKEGDTTTMRQMMRTSTERRKLFDKPKN